MVRTKTGCGSAEVSVGMILLVTPAQDKVASLCRNEEFGEAGDARIISLPHPSASRRRAEERRGGM